VQDIGVWEKRKTMLNKKPRKGLTQELTKSWLIYSGVELEFDIWKVTSIQVESKDFLIQGKITSGVFSRHEISTRQDSSANITDC
jgi:hypothetical protein